MKENDKDKELDELMERMIQRKKAESNIENFLSKMTGHGVKPINKQQLMDLMERVDAIESEEEKEKIIGKFFKDVIEGKMTPYE